MKLAIKFVLLFNNITGSLGMQVPQLEEVQQVQALQQMAANLVEPQMKEKLMQLELKDGDVRPSLVSEISKKT